MAYVIGLTGGIAAGKSLASKYLQRKGLYVVDCDLVYAELTLPGGTCWKAIRDTFGPEVFTGDALDRRKLADRVFGDEEQRAKLNACTHPLIKQECLRRLAAAQDKVVLLDAPLLFEAGWQDVADQIWCVCCSDEVRVQRLMARNGLTRTQALKRMAPQLGQEERAAQSDRVFWNEDTPEALYAQLDEALAAVYGGLE